MINIKNFQHDKLTIKNWQLSKAQSWCVLGKNGSGKQYLDQLMTGGLTDSTAQKCLLPSVDKVALVSFEKQQSIYEHELKIDRTDYLDVQDIGTKAKDFLPASKLDDPLIEAFGLAHRLEYGYRQLSTGESRKLLILQAIFNGVELLICDNPFDSLDESSCQALSKVLRDLCEQGITVLLLLSNRLDIPSWCRNIAFIERGQLEVIGLLESEETIRQLDALLDLEQDSLAWPDSNCRRENINSSYLVKLNRGKVSYNGENVFENLNVCIKPQQHTLITGPNGSGKSTLMHLITGDCTQCYSNDLEVLGFKRGSGESIWQLKKQMGIVSSELHRQYRVNAELLTVVVSGFYDSIGLYQQPERKHIEIAKQWLEKVGLLVHAHRLFQTLSYGEQRLALIARALVKSPYLLILDEPTQGLDELNRYRILNFIEHLAEQNHSTILLVSHRKDEHLSLFKQHIRM
ncbi:ATP-binding cassette domain-containing protein [Thalassotalea sp. HSM 43]|uniref:ATP-binding cassette domain-containing protein n=1 Tax=Thalassotalea sp. HSM 43 TaxID=2552945 RepID=UPI00108064E7|nr:ATP-binding cassette domain-containing protein [Thalassotalea sp. HSM 43]QBY03559.1 ATP-binding cassette domain-containing protein [Thalassotalea sp. HSM 43]